MNPLNSEIKSGLGYANPSQHHYETRTPSLNQETLWAPTFPHIDHSPSLRSLYHPTLNPFSSHRKVI